MGIWGDQGGQNRPTERGTGSGGDAFSRLGTARVGGVDATGATEETGAEADWTRPVWGTPDADIDVDREPPVEGPVAAPRTPELRAEFDRFDWLPEMWVELPESEREECDEWVLAARTRYGARRRAKAVRQRLYYFGSLTGMAGSEINPAIVGGW